MQNRSLGSTGLTIAPLVFGGNVFGWTADKARSFELLDALVDAGFDTIDTADSYGNGTSESIIGQWLADRPLKRQDLTIFTKVGSRLGDGREGLSARWIDQAVEDSLSRLQTDYIDVYFAHFPDADTTHRETLTAFTKLVDAGKVRAIGASNYNHDQLEAARACADEHDLAGYEVLQPEYSLVRRASFEGPLAEFVAAQNLGVVSYFTLASGFLTGKYRSEDDLEGRERGKIVQKYLNDQGLAVVDALEDVGRRVDATPAEVAVAWTLHHDGITAPIASATNLDQLESLIKAARLELGHDDLEQLAEVSF